MLTRNTTAMTSVDAASVVLQVDVQTALTDAETDDEPPNSGVVCEWAQTAYATVSDTPAELTVRIVGRKEITQLNRDYRSKDKPTNVLSFPVEIEHGVALSLPLLGDVIVCHSVIVEEAVSQNKAVLDHYAHMVTHGVLHLCGFDHHDDHSAKQMEALEVRALARRGITNPYG